MRGKVQEWTSDTSALGRQCCLTSFVPLNILSTHCIVPVWGHYLQSQHKTGRKVWESVCSSDCFVVFRSKGVCEMFKWCLWTFLLCRFEYLLDSHAFVCRQDISKCLCMFSFSWTIQTHVCAAYQDSESKWARDIMCIVNLCNLYERDQLADL